MTAIEEIERLYEAKLHHQSEKLTLVERNDKLEKMKNEKLVQDIIKENEEKIQQLQSKYLTKIEFLEKR